MKEHILRRFVVFGNLTTEIILLFCNSLDLLVTLLKYFTQPDNTGW